MSSSLCCNGSYQREATHSAPAGAVDDSWKRPTCKSLNAAGYPLHATPYRTIFKTTENVSIFSLLPDAQHLHEKSMNTSICEEVNPKGRSLDLHTLLQAVPLPHERDLQKLWPTSYFNKGHDHHSESSTSYTMKLQSEFCAPGETPSEVDLYDCMSASQVSGQSCHYHRRIQPALLQHPSTSALLEHAPGSDSSKSQRPSKQKRLTFKHAAEKVMAEIKRNPYMFNMEDLEGQLPPGLTKNIKAKEKFMARIQHTHAKALQRQQRQVQNREYAFAMMT